MRPLPQIPVVRWRPSFGMVSGWLRDDPAPFWASQHKLSPFPHIPKDNIHTLLRTRPCRCLSILYKVRGSNMKQYQGKPKRPFFADKTWEQEGAQRPPDGPLFSCTKVCQQTSAGAAWPLYRGRRGIFLEKNHERLCGFRRNHYICNFNAIQRFVCATPRKDWLADRSSEDEGFFTSIT